MNYMNIGVQINLMRYMRQTKEKMYIRKINAQELFMSMLKEMAETGRNLYYE